MAQIKKLFKDDYETIPGNCDTMIYLGGNEKILFLLGDKRTFFPCLNALNARHIGILSVWNKTLSTMDASRS